MTPMAGVTSKRRDQSVVEREPGLAGASIPWNERPTLNIPTAASLLGCSPAQIYALANNGELELVRLAGRTCVRTSEVEKLIRGAQPWAASGRNREAVTERNRRVEAKTVAA